MMLDLQELDDALYRGIFNQKMETRYKRRNVTNNFTNNARECEQIREYGFEFPTESFFGFAVRH